MRHTMRLSSIVLPIAFAWLLASGQLTGQEGGPDEKPTEKPAPVRAVRGRLPAYFAAVVTPAQRAEVYEIQSRFQDQIAGLQKQIAEMEMQRDKAVDGVLTAEQLAEVQKKREAAAERRRARSQPTDSETTSLR